LIRSALLCALLLPAFVGAQPATSSTAPSQPVEAPSTSRPETDRASSAPAVTSTDAGAPATAAATDADEDARSTGEPTPSPIDRHRASIEELNERMIGSASQSVRYNWRKMNAGVAFALSSLLELNNFGSSRMGVAVRRPVWFLMGEVALTRVSTWGTDSSEKLSLTPYRQFARPSRFELDVNLAMPLAEGVVTAWPSFFPATQLVFSANAGFRYAVYPGSFGGLSFLETTTALIAPHLSPREIANLEPDRVPGMQIDTARYGVLVGLSVDVYFHQGLFLSPRAMINVPLLHGFQARGGLGWFWELSCGLGWAF
jgi:hypothetical protein